MQQRCFFSAKGWSYSDTVPSLDKFLSLTLAVLHNVMRGRGERLPESPIVTVGFQEKGDETGFSASNAHLSLA